MSTVYFIDWVSPAVTRRTAPATPTPTPTPDPTPAPVLIRPTNLTPNPPDADGYSDGGFSFTLSVPDGGQLPKIIRSLWLPEGADRSVAAMTLFDAPQPPKVDIVPTGPQQYHVAAPANLPDGTWDVGVVSAFDVPDAAAPTPTPGLSASTPPAA